MSNMFDIFDSWPTLLKTRTEEALTKAIEVVSEKIQGKSVDEISFSCIHPSHEGEIVKHILGSVEGNIHFLSGFGSPAFHVAPYHYQLIDPELPDDIAKAMCDKHPGNPRLWDDIVNEGDLQKGLPHPGVEDMLKAVEEEKQGLRVSSGAGTYRAVPEEQMIYSTHNDHRYRWDLVQDSYFAAANPKIAAAMDAKKKIKKSSNTSQIPDMVKHQVQPGTEFSDLVYPLVRVDFPRPGSVMTIPVPGADPVYGVVKSGSLDFYDKSGASVEIVIYDRAYSSFDLTKSGDIHPSILYNFASKYLNIDDELIKSISNSLSLDADNL